MLYYTSTLTALNIIVEDISVNSISIINLNTNDISVSNNLEVVNNMVQRFNHK